MLTAMSSSNGATQMLLKEDQALELLGRVVPVLLVTRARDEAHEAAPGHLPQDLLADVLVQAQRPLC